MNNYSTYSCFECLKGFHLGNVLEVVSDRKLQVDNSTFDSDTGEEILDEDDDPLPDGLVDYHIADIVSQNDYYPFGMLLPNRNEDASSNYRYSFQGQEKDDEVKGENNSVNYKYRMHDPRVGRFFAVDPLAMEYPYNGPYNFSENRVIDGLELEGLELYIPNEYKATRWEYGGKGSTGNVSSFIGNVGVALWNGAIDTWNYAGDLTNPDDYWDFEYSIDKIKTDATAVYEAVDSYLSNHSAEEIMADLGEALSKPETWENIISGLIPIGTLTKASKLKLFKITDEIRPFKNLPETGSIDPSTIRFSQNSIKSTFRDGGKVSDLTKGLKDGTINPSSIDPIRIVEKDGMTFSLDNRRLKT